MDASPKRLRTAILCAPLKVDIAWAATKLLSEYKARAANLEDGAACWVHIDEIGDFLKKRQVDANRVKFDDDDPNTRYALPHTPEHPKGWEDVLIAIALQGGVEKGLLNHLQNEKGHYFAPREPDAKTYYKPRNYNTPDLPEWESEHT